MASFPTSIPRSTAPPPGAAAAACMEELLGITYPQGCYNDLLDLPARPFAALFTYEVDPNERMDGDVVPHQSSSMVRSSSSSSSSSSNWAPPPDGEFSVPHFQEALRRDLPSWAVEVRDSSRSGLPQHIKVFSPHLVGRSGAVALCVALIKLEWMQRLFGLRLTRLTLQVTTTDLDIYHLISLCQSYVIFEDCIWRLLVHGSTDIRIHGRHSRALSTKSQPLRKVCRLLARAANMDDYSNSSFRHLTHLFEDPKKHGGSGGAGGRSPRGAAATAASLRQRGGRAARTMAQGTAESRPFLFDITHMLPKEPDGPTWVEFHTIPTRADFLTVQPWLTFVICFVHGACKLQPSQVDDLVELFSRKLKPLQPPGSGHNGSGDRSSKRGVEVAEHDRSGADTTRTTATSSAGGDGPSPFSWAGFGGGDGEEDEEGAGDDADGEGDFHQRGGTEGHRHDNSSTLNEAAAHLALQFYILFDLVLDFPALYRCCYETHCPDEVQMLLPAVLPSQELRLGMNLSNPSDSPTAAAVAATTSSNAFNAVAAPVRSTIPGGGGGVSYVSKAPKYYSLSSITEARPPAPARGKSTKSTRRRPQTAGAIPAAASFATTTSSVQRFTNLMPAKTPRIPVIQATLRRDRPVSALHHREEGNPLLIGGGSLLLAYEPLLNAPFAASSTLGSPLDHHNNEGFFPSQHGNDWSEGPNPDGNNNNKQDFEARETGILGEAPHAGIFGAKKNDKRSAVGNKKQTSRHSNSRSNSHRSSSNRPSTAFR